MSSNKDDNEFWENLVVFIVLGGLAVLGYREVEPTIDRWLDQHHAAVHQAEHVLGSISLDLVTNVAAAILGLFLVITLLLAWRRLRRKGRKHRRVW